jgi:hypothetical protein
MPADDDPDVLATERAHLATLADTLHKTVEQLQASGKRDDERRKQNRRAADVGAGVLEHERRTGNGRRREDNPGDHTP